MRNVEEIEAQPEQPKQTTPATPTPKRETKIEPKRPTVTTFVDEEEEEIFVEGDEKGKNWRNKMKKLFDKMSNSFTGNEDELEL